MKHILLLIAFAIIGWSVHGQNLISESIDPTFRNSELLFNYGSYDGTPFLNEQWNSVEIHTTLNGILEEEEANFDVYSQKLIVAKGDRRIAVNDNQIVFFILKDDFGQKKKYVQYKNTSKIEYYELIHEGRLHVYKAFQKKFTKPDENSKHNYGGGVSEKPYFSRNNLSYYIKFDEGNLVKTALTKKSIEKLLPDNYAREFKRLLQKEKVSFKKEEELKSFLTNFETVLKK